MLIICYILGLLSVIMFILGGVMDFFDKRESEDKFDKTNTLLIEKINDDSYKSDSVSDVTGPVIIRSMLLNDGVDSVNSKEI